eukprot:115435_1
MAAIDWENESDSSEDEERYLSKKDCDEIINKEMKLKISTKFTKYDDFKIPSGYLSHSLYVCPIQSDYAPDPQTKLGCGHIISYKALARLRRNQIQRLHQDNRNRKIKMKSIIAYLFTIYALASCNRRLLQTGSPGVTVKEWIAP